MTDVKPEELSAFLDGELTGGRAAEVREALERQPELLREFEALGMIDRRLRTAADEASFDPRIALPSQASVDSDNVYWPAGIAILGLLLLARFLPKFTDAIEIGLAFQLVVGAAILRLVMKLLDEQEPVRSALLSKGGS